MGGNKCHASGRVKLELRKGETFAAGPFKGTVIVRQTPPFTPALQDAGAIEVGLTVTGLPEQLRPGNVLRRNRHLVRQSPLQQERSSMPCDYHYGVGPAK
jgi:hypothetical protein